MRLLPGLICAAVLLAQEPERVPVPADAVGTSVQYDVRFIRGAIRNRELKLDQGDLCMYPLIPGIRGQNEADFSCHTGGMPDHA